MSMPSTADGRRPDDLSMNETPYPPLPSIRLLVQEGSAEINRYPDRRSAALVAALATRLDVPEDAIVVGPGSAGLCQHLIQAFGAKPEVVHAALTFEGFPLFVRNAGARSVAVPMNGYGHDLPAMAAAVTSDTRCVLLCNPNNPTGALLHRGEIEAFLDRIPGDVPVVIDEAYRDFVTDPDAPDGVDIYRGHENVCVLRTFSKAYGLAALRIGYAVLPPRITPLARLIGAVFFPGSLAQAAALASLEPGVTAELMQRCAALAVSRTRLAEALRGLGLTVAPSEANFLWLPVGSEAEAFAGAALQARILVWPVAGQGVRITIGSDEVNARLIEFVRDAWPQARSDQPGSIAASDR
jgi:histidinol-phosphate aminotransferase